MTPKNLNQKKKIQSLNQIHKDQAEAVLNVKLIWIISVLILLEIVYQYVPQRDLIPLHIEITAYFIRSLIYAGLIFSLVDYRFFLAKLITLIWFVSELQNLLVRLTTDYYRLFETKQDAINFNQFFIAVGWLYIIIPTLWLFYRARYFANQPSDRYNKKDTFLLFKRPENFLGLLLTFSFSPTSSVSVFHKDIQYCYKKDVDGFHKTPATKTERNRGRLIRIIPPKNFTAFLESKIGTKYKLIRHNCITVLKGSGIHIGPFDFIPSIFSSRFN